MVRQVSSLSEFDKVLREAGSKLVVIDFFAQWCGPCHFIAPFVEKLATKYPQVVFVKVDVDQASDVASTCGISAMPTFHFYKNNQKVDQVVGADPNTLENVIKKHMTSMEQTGGHVLGHGEPSNTTINWNIGKTQQQEANVSKPLYNEEYLKQLVEMGFPELRAKRALLRTKQESVETAMNWLFEHMEDEDIDSPLEEEEQAAATEMTQNSSSSLSEEEKRARAQEALERVRKKRQEEEKKAEIEREKNRVKTGKELAEAKAALEEQKRKAHVEKLQKEKMEAQKERERLRELLRQDREERLARMGNHPTSVEKQQQNRNPPENSNPRPSSTHQQGSGVVQLRFPDGSKLESEFESHMKLREIARFVENNRPDIPRFTLAQTYPRKIFTEEELNTLTIQDAQLIPRGLLLVNRK